MTAAPQVQDLKFLPDDPFEVININNANRHPGVDNKVLWTAKEIHDLNPPPFKYPFPTLAPPAWPTPRRINQDQYSVDFAKRHPFADLVLHKVNVAGVPAKVIVAGGAAASPYYERDVTAGDVDFFLVGINPDDRAALWHAAHRIVNALRDIIKDEGSSDLYPGYQPVEMAQKMTPGLITLTLLLRSKDYSWRRRRVMTLKFQIILRAYPSVAAALHAFDVGACCVAYDGTTALATTMGAFAQIYRINLVNPAYRSTTYEDRLAKYFIERHYALGFVDLKTGVLVVGKPLKLTHFVVTPAVVRGNRAIGTVRVPSPRVKSDYDPAQSDLKCKYGCWDAQAMAIHAAALHNVAQLAKESNYYAMVRCTDGLLSRRAEEDREPYEMLPLGAFYGKPEAEDGPVPDDEPTLEFLLPRSLLEDTLDKIIKGAYDPHGRVRAKGLVKYLGMTSADVARYVEGLMTLAAANPGRKIDATAALQPFRDEIVRRYEDACKEPITWFITHNPERQFTASNNPQMEDPKEWYGEDLVELDPGKVSPEVYEESLLATPDVRADAAPVYSGQCPLCLEEIMSGVANSVTLDCGHTFHWSRNVNTGCEGLYRWTLGEHSDCPTCRTDFSGNAVSVAAKDDPDGPVVLRIEWGARGARGAPPGAPSEDIGDE
jgi:hypothetical protein